MSSWGIAHPAEGANSIRPANQVGVEEGLRPRRLVLSLRQTAIDRLPLNTHSPAVSAH
jgi:hypothetical protein